jgi:uncharacterized membrane protein YvlD (DUF360 family)
MMKPKDVACRAFVRLLIGAWSRALVPGVEIHGAPTLFIAALLLGIVNAFVRPLIVR